MIVDRATLERVERLEANFGAAVRLLNDAVTTIIDTDLRREWEAERARLRGLLAEGEESREP